MKRELWVMKKNKFIIACLIILTIILVQPRTWQVVRNFFTQQDFASQFGIKDAPSKKQQLADLQSLEYAGKGGKVINHNQPTFDDFSGQKLILGKLDLTERPTGGKAIFGPRNPISLKSKVTSSVNPVGWFGGGKVKLGSKPQKMFVKSRLLPSAKADQTPKQNLFTGTLTLNNSLQDYQRQIARYITTTHHHVKYQIDLVYAGAKLIPMGVHLQAASQEDQTIKINEYLFNEEPGYVINHLTGKVEPAKAED